MDEEQEKEGVQVNDKIESLLSIEPAVDLSLNNSPQHILDLEEEYIAPNNELITFGTPETIGNNPKIAEEKKIVFELNTYHF